MLKGRREVQGRAREERCVYLSSWLPRYILGSDFTTPDGIAAATLDQPGRNTLRRFSQSARHSGRAPQPNRRRVAPPPGGDICRFAVNSDDEMEDEVASNDASEPQLHGQQLGMTSTCMRTLPSSRAASMCGRQVRG